MYNPEKRGKDKRKAAQFALYHTFLDVNKLMAPIMPHITEAAYGLYWKDKENKMLKDAGKEPVESIHNSSWPVYDEKFVDETVEETGDKAVEIIGAVRKYKSEKGLSLKAEILILTIECDEKTRKELEFVEEDMLAVCNAEKLDFEGKGDIEVSENIRVGIEMKAVEEKKK